MGLVIIFRLSNDLRKISLNPLDWPLKTLNTFFLPHFIDFSNAKVHWKILCFLISLIKQFKIASVLTARSGEWFTKRSVFTQYKKVTWWIFLVNTPKWVWKDRICLNFLCITEDGSFLSGNLKTKMESIINDVSYGH